MLWNVKGIDRAIGNERSVEVEADNEASAIRRANRLGLVVESATPVEAEIFAGDVSDDIRYEASLPPLDETPAQVAARMKGGLSDLAAAASRSQTGRPVVNHRRAAGVPEYGSITIGAAIIRGYGVVVLLLGLLLVLTGTVDLMRLNDSTSRLESIADRSAAILEVITGLGAILGAALVWMIASLAVAVRDIARNSFK